MLETIKGTPLNFFPLVDLELIADLIYLNGPILSLLKHSNGDYYLYRWSDVDDQFNRWLVFRIRYADLCLYIKEKEITLRQLILNPADGFLYSVDIDDDLIYHNIVIIKPSDLPVSYLPTENTYYKFEPIYYDISYKIKFQERDEIFIVLDKGSKSMSATDYTIQSTKLHNKSSRDAK